MRQLPPGPSGPVTSRRTVLTGAVTAAAAAALTSACGDEGSGGRVLAPTSGIPVGGGRVFADEKVVVTQPAEGEFKAFSAVCTHQGCTVGSVTNGLINCPCHASRFRIADASVASGPATRPLPERKITVEDGSVRLL
ncbi:Rieske (2Fe-2S) protein [Streptomyces thermolilacinus]|uniref:Cytochrome bc1 complex Rieske iron-sulfur subunit n=1 Tax=Streptomyces thermolilacinus SPC6 TaxID=1306406 RepID=A0A1D3DX07_9ACTN|nr:Rieske (2Fe-2S) protein [Streptomyces thermolilacinus]OEJ96855.1 iron-sulfur protein [Streptomyces thermolilacinus SPC6]